MKTLISVTFGAVAFAAATFGMAQPASADVYIGAPGVRIDVDRYGGACRDYWFHRAHPYRCGYGYRYREYPVRYERDRCWNRWFRYHHPYLCRYRDW